MRRPTLYALSASALAWLLIAHAATPAEQTVVLPTRDGEVVTVSWEGSIPAGANPTSSCDGLPDALRDVHSIILQVPSGIYQQVRVTAEFRIAWESADNDLILSLVKDGVVLGDSDGGDPAESIAIENPPDGVFQVIGCPFTAPTATSYTGTLVLTAQSAASVMAPASADPQGLEFSASVMADIQRDEAEPLIEVDGDGIMYTCGPTGTSQAAEYAQVSTDGGDQFHLIGAPPRGQFSQGGGGDCGLATGVVRNSKGYFDLAYTGLSGLVNFTTATSPDGGRTLNATPTSESIPGVDRQWNVFSDATTVFLNYNALQPRVVTVQKSTDGGLTYGPRVGVSPNPSFPGPMRSMPPALNPSGNGQPVVYYPWTAGSAVNLAVSLDNGTTWNNCLAATAKGDPSQSFPVADHDREGNLYLGYTDSADWGAYVAYAPRAELLNCNGGTAAGFEAKMAFSEPLLANRGETVTTIFPWLVASGARGRVAITYIGSKTPGSPGDLSLKHTWHVYVSQSLDMNTASPRFAQVQATSHPMYFDQICLDGLGCTVNMGDRSMADFYAIDLNPANGELVIVYNATHKRPGQIGQVASPMVIRQIAGPSNLGGRVDNAGRKVLREVSIDPEGDALAQYSNLYVTPTPVNIPAADVRKVSILPATDLATGAPLAAGGFTVSVDVADLSNAALQAALTDTPGQSLLWIFRFQGGYRQSAVSARWNPAQGFSFGFNDYEGTTGECGSPPTPEAVGIEGCIYYSGGTAVQGAVDQAAGNIRMTVPLSLLKAMEGQGGRGAYPPERAAQPGDRMYAAALYAQVNPTSPVQTAQAFLVPLDNSPAMDFLIPGEPPVGSSSSSGGSGSSGGSSGSGSGGGTPVSGPDAGRFGGSLGLALTLPLAAGLWRRRRRMPAAP